QCAFGFGLVLGKIAGLFRGVERGASFDIKIHMAAQMKSSGSVVAGGKVDRSTFEARGVEGLLNRRLGVIGFVAGRAKILYVIDHFPADYGCARGIKAGASDKNEC